MNGLFKWYLFKKSSVGQQYFRFYSCLVTIYDIILLCCGLKIGEKFVNYFKHAFIIGFTPYVFVITGKLASTAFRWLLRFWLHQLKKWFVWNNWQGLIYSSMQFFLVFWKCTKKRTRIYAWLMSCHSAIRIVSISAFWWLWSLKKSILQSCQKSGKNYKVWNFQVIHLIGSFLMFVLALDNWHMIDPT